MATLELDKEDTETEVLTLRFQAGTVDSVFGGTERLLRKMQLQIDASKRQQIVLKYIKLSDSDRQQVDATIAKASLLP